MYHARHRQDLDLAGALGDPGDRGSAGCPTTPRNRLTHRSWSDRSASLRRPWAVHGAGVIVLAITDATSDQMQMPSATLMHAVATWLSMSSPMANGAAAPHTVARPMIHSKNARGIGVATATPCATPVATRARTNAVTA